MSGRGQRFKDAGYVLPKPLIDVNGKPMIKRVVDNLNLVGRYIFLVLKEQYDDYNLKEVLSFTGAISSEIVIVDKVTDGAARTCLLAKHLIDNDDQLVIANSDQLVDWEPENFLEIMIKDAADGGILTFTAHESKWSFAKVMPQTNIITEVAEKNPISNKATAGIYWFKHGRYFASAAEQMINKNIRTNNEFYVCPIFNELIELGHKICDYPIKSMTGLGTPEDLEKFLYK